MLVGREEFYLGKDGEMEEGRAEGSCYMQKSLFKDLDFVEVI